MNASCLQLKLGVKLCWSYAVKILIQNGLGNSARCCAKIGIYLIDSAKFLCHGKICHRHDHGRLLLNLKSNSYILSFMTIKFF